MNMWKTLNKGIMKAFGMNIETDTATLNDESFLEWVGIKRDSESKKPTSDVTYLRRTFGGIAAQGDRGSNPPLEV